MIKYEEVKKKITDILPGILELKFGCEVLDTEYGRNDINIFISTSNNFTHLLIKGKEFQEWNNRFKEHYKILGRPITFEDVIIAIRSKHKPLSSKEESIVERLLYGKLDGSGKWIMGESLNKQSEVVWHLIYKLLI